MDESTAFGLVVDLIRLTLPTVMLVVGFYGSITANAKKTREMERIEREKNLVLLTEIKDELKRMNEHGERRDKRLDVHGDRMDNLDRTVAGLGADVRHLKEEVKKWEN